MKAIIADDEPHLAQYLRDKLAKLWPELQIVAMADSGPAAAAAIAQHAPDIAFLDIEMPGASGLQLADHLPDQGTIVVFITAFSNYAAQAFDVSATDYVLKPFSDERFKEALDRAKRRVRERRLVRSCAQAREHSRPTYSLRASAVPSERS